MQTLDDLIRRTSWAEIEAALLDCYPREAEEVDRFRPVWERLGSLRPSPSTLVLRFEWHEDSCGEWLSVFGEDGSLRSDGEPEGFALEYMPWSKWLGIAVPDELGRAFAESEIVAHCLYEMTTVAFDPRSEVSPSSRQHKPFIHSELRGSRRRIRVHEPVLGSSR